ncbi:MAG: VTT domain-containing protein [bacterium]|nr:VTT domain-containing protein [bacterium]
MAAEQRPAKEPVTVSSGPLAEVELSSSPLKDLTTIIIVGVIFLLLALLLRSDLVRDIFENVHRIRSFLKSDAVPGGLAGSGAVFVLGTGILISLGVPRIWISALGGAVYGAALGAVFSLCSSIIGATALFFAGSTFLGSVAQRRLRNRAGKFVERLNREAFWWTLYLRLFPFSNSTVQSLLFGSLRVPFSAFISGSILGFIPLTVVFAMFGSGGVKGNYYQIWLGFGFIAAVALLRFLMNQVARGKTAEDRNS